MELADTGHPRQRHLRVDRPGQRQVAARIQPLGHLVHLLPPGPKRTTAGLPNAAQCAVEGMRVGVRQARQGEPGQRDGARGEITGADPGRDGAEPVAGRLDQHPGADAAAGSQASSACHRRAAARPSRVRSRPASSGDHRGQRLTPAGQSAWVGMLGRGVRDPGSGCARTAWPRAAGRTAPRVVARPGRQHRSRDTPAAPSRRPPVAQARVEGDQRRDRFAAACRTPPRAGRPPAPPRLTSRPARRSAASSGARASSQAVTAELIAFAAPGSAITLPNVASARARPPPPGRPAPRRRTGASGRAGRRAASCPRDRPAR